MTVLKNKRAVGNLEVITKARKLAKYSLLLAKNEKIFPKRNRWLLTQPIVQSSLNIFTNMRKANSIEIRTKADFEQCRALQQDAYAECEALLSLIEIAYTTLNIQAKRIEFWTGLVVELEQQLLTWKERVFNRYSSL